MAISTKCCWYLTLFYDVLFAISGFLFLSFNSYILYKLAIYKPLVGIKSLTPLIVHVILGVIYIIMSWCGWKVASAIHKVHLTLYCVLLTLMTLVQFACIVWIIFILTNTMESELNENATSQFLSSKNDSEVKKLWDGVQTKMQCCGLGGPTDYRESQSVPYSCCKKSETGSDCSTIYQQGCLLSLYDKFYYDLIHAGLSSFGMMIVQIIGVVAHYSLAKSVRDSNDSSNQSSPQTEASATLLRQSQASKY